MLQDVTQVVLTKALDATALRHRAIANNLANVETPGYTREDVSFEDQLRSAIQDASSSESVSEDAVQGIDPNLTYDTNEPIRENGNNVDVDKEMAKLAENTIQYETLLQSLSIKDGMIRSAIYEGRK